MTGKEIREKFLKFFEERGHLVLPSASLIPANDPSILWTAAGMVPFKPYFTGSITPDFKRVTTCQKCLRTPDIESVGLTSRHHTFFEMLGNFSFGDYFKEEVIPWAWEFVTRVLELPASRLWVSIFQDDDEAFEIWRRSVGIPADRIVRMGRDSNFWEIGVGPCGPCSEVYVDMGEERGCGSEKCGVGCECDRFLEIWNLVFIQYFRDEAGNYTTLELKGIDTGMGLERVASVCQDVPTNFDTDLFRGIMDYVASFTGARYGVEAKKDLALKVIADHIRAVTFAVADGALPANDGRGYVLRRLLRRAMRFGRLLGIQDTFLSLVADEVVRQMGNAYNELIVNRDNIIRVIHSEETRFTQTLAQGTEILENLIRKARTERQVIISGEDVFRLHDTYGFPLELTKEIIAEEGLTVDEDGFKSALEEQRKRARKSRQETSYISEEAAFYKNIRDKFGETEFIGYDILEAKGRVILLINDKRPVEQVTAGEEIEFILDVTPCYAESGGQVTDKAVVLAPEGEVEVINVQKPVEGLYLHRGKVRNGVLRKDDVVRTRVDLVRRQEISRNHSATHLLHKALKQVLGGHVNQAGSLVAPEQLRFDFTHHSALTPQELNMVENIVNEVIWTGIPVEVDVTSFQKAKEMGATALFGEKYGEKVRIVKIGDFSLELCGGTHVKSTAEIGLLKLAGESSIGAGLRRVEALTGRGALRYLTAREDQIAQISSIFRTAPNELVSRSNSLMKEIRELEKENEQLRARLARYEVNALLDQVRDLNGVKLLAAKAEASDMDDLRGMVDLLRDRMNSGIIVLGSQNGVRANLVASVTKDLLPRGLHAGKLIKELASIIDGGGGGKPEMAQAGGKNPSRLQEALDKAYAVAGKQLRL